MPLASATRWSASDRRRLHVSTLDTIDMTTRRLQDSIWWPDSCFLAAFQWCYSTCKPPSTGDRWLVYLQLMFDSDDQTIRGDEWETIFSVFLHLALTICSIFSNFRYLQCRRKYRWKSRRENSVWLPGNTATDLVCFQRSQHGIHCVLSLYG